jgi:uncharacterized membrane protein
LFSEFLLENCKYLIRIKPQVFAAVASLQAIMGFASPIFNLIYINTLDTYIGMVYLIDVIFYAVLLALLVYTFFFLKRVESKDTIELISVSKSRNTLS